jgi:hypothetical protein
VSALSLWALVSGHWSAWQAARVEVRQHEEAQQAQRRDVPGEVVDALLARTSIGNTTIGADRVRPRPASESKGVSA